MIHDDVLIPMLFIHEVTNERRNCHFLMIHEINA